MKRGLLRIVLVMGGVLMAGLALPQHARADACTVQHTVSGRACGYGFFYNKYQNTASDSSIIDNGIACGTADGTANATCFISTINKALRCTATGPGSNGQLANPNNQSAYGAAFIVLTMLGYPAGTVKDTACDQYDRWAGLVTDYQKAGLIQWNQRYAWNGNTYAQLNFEDDGYMPATAPTYQNELGDPAIVFYSQQAHAPLYALRHAGGAPVDHMSALVPLSGPPSGMVLRPAAIVASPGGDSSSAAGTSCTQVAGSAIDPDAPATAIKVVATYSNGAAPTDTMTDPVTHQFSMATPGSVQNSVNPVRVHIYVVDGATGAQIELNDSPINLSQCFKPVAQCAGYTMVIGSSIMDSPDPNLPFRITARISYATPDQAQAVLDQTAAQFYLRVDGPNIAGPGGNTYNNQLETPVRHDPGSNVVYVTHDFAATRSTGAYTIGWGINSTPGAIVCGGNALHGPNGSPAIFDILAHPYFEVGGGDVSAGSGISGVPGSGSACTDPTRDTAANKNAGIVGWNLAAAAAYKGAGTNFGAYALNYIQSFVSGQRSSNAATGQPLDPVGLSFSNTTTDGRIDLTRGLYGGNFGTFGSCLPNVFKAAQATHPPSTGQNVDATFTGLPIVNGALTVPNGKHIVKYIDGDAVIRTNIAYAGSGNGYDGAQDIPSFTLVVRGDIYISRDVSRLDGIYLAQPTVYPDDAAKSNPNNKGRIFTCAPPAVLAQPLTTNLLLSANLFTDCGAAPLVVNGAFLARQVWLLRSYDSISGGPAETFNYTPEIWLTDPFGDGGVNINGNYDAITGLPPVL